MDGEALIRLSDPRGRARAAALAKISPPRIGRVLLRPRLFNLLDSCREYPVTWLSAPAGSGKTTLAASYLAERKPQTLWYQVDEGDNDQATFFYYMGLATQKAASRARRPMPLLTRTYALGIPTFTLRYFEELYGRLKPPAVLVFDNYQLVPPESAFHERISQGLAIVPGGIRVLVLSRNDPPAQFARLRANEQIHLVNSGVIDFTLQESEAFLRARGLPGAPENAVGRVHELTQGWAAGLALLAESTRLRVVRDDTVPLFSSEEVFHYFAREIFDKLDDEAREVLVRTAYLPRMTGSMAERLSGSPRAKEILGRLCRDHFFAQRDNQPDPFYQYHPLFHEFLQTRARQHFSDEQRRVLVMEAAKLLEEEGRVEDAADLLLSGSVWERLVPLLIAHGTSLMSQGRHAVVEAWLEKVPQEDLGASPWLLFWLGTSRIYHKSAEAWGLLERAFAEFESAGDRIGAALACSGVMECITARVWDYSALGPWMARLESLLQGGLSFDPPELELMVAEAMANALESSFPYRCAELEEWLHRALLLCRQAGYVDREVNILALGQLHYIGVKDAERGSFYAREIEALASRTHSQAAFFLPKLARLVTEPLLGIDRQSILQQTSEVLEFAHRNGICGIDMLVTYLALHMALHIHDMGAAADLLRQMEKVVDMGSERAAAIYRTHAAWYYLETGDLSRARRIVSEIPDGSPTWDFFIHGQVSHLKAVIFWMHGDREEAFRQLAIYKEVAAHFQGPSYLGFLGNVLEARFRLAESEDDEQGVRCLSTALSIAKALGYEHVAMMYTPQILGDLYVKALRNNIETEYVRRLIKGGDIFPEAAPFDIPAWPWPVRVNTLGRFEVLVDDKPLEMTRLKKKPLLLLKALVAMGGENIREEYLGELLWPDAEGDMAYDAFRTTLSRLRHLLGSEGAILVHEGALSLNPKRVWVDTAAFLRLCATAERKKEGARNLAAKVLELYRGEFLPMEEEPWMVSIREKLRERFLRLIIAQGKESEDEGRWEEAIACYRAAIDADDLAEEVYQRLMLCHGRLEDRTAALSAYGRLCKVLRARLDIAPSPKTEAIYREIKAGMA
jgi:DNA-binding SARP family transcriptional activator